MAYERVTLYGIPIVASRRVGYGRIDPVLSRELFIRHALVEGDWQTHHAFFQRNLELIAEVEDLEHRARRRDLLVGDETCSRSTTSASRRCGIRAALRQLVEAGQARSARLADFDPAMLVSTAAVVSRADYPDTWPLGPLPLQLTYQFEPGTDADGVTVHVPLDALGQVAAESSDAFEWQVPGLREELVTALIRSLPRLLRRHSRAGAGHRPSRAAAAASQDGRLVDAGAPAATPRRAAGAGRRVRPRPGACASDRDVRVVDDVGATSPRQGPGRAEPQAARAARTAVATAAGGSSAPACGAGIQALPALVELTRTATGHAYPRWSMSGQRGDRAAYRRSRQ
jgi:ATP-dependent helicase HrpA